MRLVKNFQRCFPLSVLFPVLKSQPVPWQECCCFKITTLIEQWEELAVLFWAPGSSSPFDSPAPRDGERGSGSPGCHPQGGDGPAGVSGECHPYLGTDGSRDAVAHPRFVSHGNSSRPALHLSSLSLREPPQCPLQHHSLLTGVRPIRAPQDRVLTSSLASSALHPSDLSSCPLQGAAPSPSPTAQAAAFQCLQRCLLSLSPDVVNGSEHLHLLQHNRLSNSILFHIFFPLLSTMSHIWVLPGFSAQPGFPNSIQHPLLAALY